MSTHEPTAEIYIERRSGGDIRKNGTRWANPTANAVKLEILAEESQANPKFRPGSKEPMRFAPIVHHFVVPPNGEIVLDSDWDDAIHRTQCRQCIGSKSVFCRDANHTDRMIVGGLGPYLRKVNGLPPTPLHPSLQEPTVVARTTAGPPRGPRPAADLDADARMLQRARERRGEPTAFTRRPAGPPRGPRP